MVSLKPVRIAPALRKSGQFLLTWHLLSLRKDCLQMGTRIHKGESHRLADFSFAGPIDSRTG